MSVMTYFGIISMLGDPLLYLRIWQTKMPIDKTMGKSLHYI
jgi:hypothetical protein